MSRDSDDAGRGFSRRTLLARVAFIGAGAVAVRGDTPAPAGQGRAAQGGAAAASTETGRPPLENLSAIEMATLEAIAAALIPSDGNGPGATEARAAHYIDRALGGALAASREAYRSGLAAVEAYARSSKGGPFDGLSAAERDAVLRDIETNKATGFVPDAQTFFNLVRTHTIQGTFGDPYYGGNANFAGWDLIGYPGIRLAAGPDDQRMDRRPARVRRSAYDNAMFSKKRPARADAARRRSKDWA
jgi:gluconate 2-dehydrogenase gamma chain